MSSAEQNHVSSGGVATGEHRPWPQALRSRVTQAIEAVQALDIDDALDVLEALAADLAALDHAYEQTSATEAYRRWKHTEA
jgi:hypothetical protein